MKKVKPAIESKQHSHVCAPAIASGKRKRADELQEGPELTSLVKYRLRERRIKITLDEL